MKSKFLLFVALALALIANGCSPATPTSDSGAQPARPSTEAFQVSYIGSDGNVWFYPGVGSEPRQITIDKTT
jgi:hypothetical protein